MPFLCARVVVPSELATLKRLGGLGMRTEASFYYDLVAPHVSFRSAVWTPPPRRLLRLCPDGVEREFELKAAIHRRQGDYIRIDYRVVSAKPQSR